MQTVNLTDPSELKVVTGWLQESRIRMVRNALLGSAAVAGALGLGVAATMWAWAQHGPTAEERAADLRAALAEVPPLQVEPVRIDPDANEVVLAEGGTVSLDQPATVTLDPGATVKLD